jgi:hypothetical protein
LELPCWRAPPGSAPRSPSLEERSLSTFPGALFIGALSLAMALRSLTRGSCSTSVSPGSSSSEELARDSLTGRFPKRLLFGGIVTGLAHECLPRGPLLGRAKAGGTHGCLPRRPLSGEIAEGLIHRRTPLLALLSQRGVPLHRASSSKPVLEASPLWRFLGTSFLGFPSGERQW